MNNLLDFLADIEGRPFAQWMEDGVRLLFMAEASPELIALARALHELALNAYPVIPASSYCILATKLTDWERNKRLVELLEALA